jgi:protein-tyrosine phosphatase
MQFADRDVIRHLKTIQTEDDAQAAYQLFLELYAAMPFDNEAFRQMLSALDDPDGVPMMQHCSAGKDRTGLGSALLLMALGVEEKIAVEDYLLTRVFREGANNRRLERMAQEDITPAALHMVAQMMTVSEDLIYAALDAIHAKYSSYESFFQEEYGISPKKLAYWRHVHTRKL